MVGVVLQAGMQRRVMVGDCFMASGTAVLGHALQSLVLKRCVFAHRCGERGHQFTLQHLGVQALLDLNLRLVEGSGAAPGLAAPSLPYGVGMRFQKLHQGTQ